ncbi:hypothetical protein [Virgibacillus sp. MG-45]|uniref:hypothetical protein n=1 Tax=Virgibacillus sp. MG-45 TaxID=3102791 RepID=UPI002ED9B8BA
MDKNFDTLLREMKDSYKNIPSTIETEQVIETVFQPRRRKRNWIRSSMLAFGTICLFVLITWAVTNQQMHSGDTEKLQLEQFFIEKKREFRDSIGIENVDQLPNVVEAKKWLERYDDTISFDSEIIREKVNQLLQTPLMQVNRLNEKDSSEGLIDLVTVMENLKVPLQTYLSQLIRKHDIDANELHKIFKLQYVPQKYDGPADIKDFLIILRHQGYRLNKVGSDILSLQVDFVWIKDNVKITDKNEKIIAYYELLGTIIDRNQPGVNNAYNIPWNEFDTILLEIETYLDKYDQEDVPSVVWTYLNDYLVGGREVGEELDQQVRNELEGFIRIHSDSMFAGFAKNALHYYETNGWISKGEMVSLAELDAISYVNHMLPNGTFDYVQEKISKEQEEKLQTFYEQYKLKRDSALLRGLEPEDVLHLFLFAHKAEDEKSVLSLYAKDNTKQVANEIQNQQVYSRMVHSSPFYFVNKEENRTVFTFKVEMNTLGQIIMDKDNQGIWKIKASTILSQ